MNTESMKWSILVVDDDPMNRESLAESLLTLIPQAEIQYATNGEQAVDVVKDKIATSQQNFNLIFMDYQMPLMNGQESTHAIRKFEKSISLDKSKIAFIVTWSASRRSPYEGANAIISKPLMSDELSVVLHEYI